MDEFGVLTERFGLKQQGKSAPMAALKLSTSSNSFQSHNSGSRTGLNGNSFSNSGFVDESFQKNTEFESYGGFDNYNDLLGSVNKSRKHSGNSGSDASSFDYDSIFFGSSNSDPASDDIFGSMPGFKSSVSTKKEGLAQSTQIDDLLGGFSRNVAKTAISKPNGLKSASNSAAPFDELIPGFEKSSSRINGANTQEKLTQQSTSHTAKSTFSSVKDPFIELESTSIPPYNSSETFSDPLEEFSKFNNSGGIKLGGSSNSSSPFRVPPIPKPGSVPKMDKEKSSSFSTIDELEDFARGKVQNNNVEGKVNASTRRVNRDNKDADAAGISHQNTVDHLDSFFSAGLRSKSVPRSRATTPDSLFDIPKYNKPTGIPKGTSSAASSNIKKSSSAVNLVDDLSFVFQDAPLFGEFQEVEGESEERRRARLRRQQMAQDRAERAVADLNLRDFHTQLEQEEKRRIAESLAADIKSWAAGKEGNMRALLSTLQNILWSGCGWEPVSLTDIITSSSVKKVYRKAVLCIHPDKVQQRGANLEQKYTAEKVFDILKEAWNKFSKEEL